MEEILKKYEDKNKFITELYSLYKELIGFAVSKEEALKIINKIYLSNIEIKVSMLDFYKKELKIQESALASKVYVDYTNNNSKESEVVEKKVIHKDFYNSFIDENIRSNNYLDILPKEYTKDSIKIFAKILNYFLVTIQFYKCLLTIETNEEDIKSINSELNMYEKKFNEILEYKEKLKNKDKSIKIVENKLIFFMCDDEPYIYYDILDNPTVYNSIKKLLDSIRFGTFKCLSKFSDYKNLLEVRDLSNQTRVIFDRRNGAYSIIGAITNKSETNKLYKERLNNRFKLYQSNLDNITELDNNSCLRKILRGEENE